MKLTLLLRFQFDYNYTISSSETTSTTHHHPTFNNQNLRNKKIGIPLEKNSKYFLVLLCSKVNASMDATSIITQVSRDDEQLNVYAGEKGKNLES